MTLIGNVILAADYHQMWLFSRNEDRLHTLFIAAFGVGLEAQIKTFSLF